MSAFTHNFEITFDGTSIEGEVEFNQDGKVSYSFKEDPTIQLEMGKLIHNLFAIVQKMYKMNGGLTKLKITEK